MSQPYVQLELERLQGEALQHLRAGKLELPDSMSLVLLPDRSGSLQPGCVAPFRDGKLLARPSELGSGDPHEVLVYGPPGMHPGDLHKVHPCLPGYAIIVTPYVPAVMR